MGSKRKVFRTVSPRSGYTGDVMLATVVDGRLVKVEGDRIEIAARCDPEDGELHYGDRVLIIDYDAQKNIYQIAPHEDDDSPS